jgi:hypothetical protein
MRWRLARNAISALAGSFAFALAFAAPTPASAPASSPPETRACSRNLDGSTFLTVSHKHGIGATSTCVLADLPANNFFAPPDKACTVEFASRTWLSEGWRFARLTGVGAFSVTSSADALVVTIEAKGGFKLQEIAVASTAPMTAGDCRSKAIDEIVR